MNTFLILAVISSLGAGIAAPFAAVLIKSYKEERLRIESGQPPSYLPSIEEIYQPPTYQYPVEDEVPKKAQGLLPQAIEVESPVGSTSTDWINNFISQTALIWGNQGSGKSWMARYLAKLKKSQGYRVIVLDPDSNRSEWIGLESYHDFEEIENFLGWYVDELKSRYSQFNSASIKESEWRANLWREGKAIAVICEEVTTYTDLIQDKELLTQFFRLGLTKSRKQEMPLTFVSHNNTQLCLGGIKGLGNLIERMLQLNLETTINSESLQPVSSGKGRVKLDGSLNWIPVTLPQLTKKTTNFGEPTNYLIDSIRKIEPQITDQQKWDRLILESTNDDINQLIDRFKGKRNDEPLNQGTESPEPLPSHQFSEQPHGSESRYTRLELTVLAARELVRELRKTMNQTEIIEYLWGCKKGGSDAWKKAHAEYKTIIQET